MSQQLHKRLSEEQVKAVLENYLAGEITVAAALENLGLKRARFFRLVKAYKTNAETFTLVPAKKLNSHLKISGEADKLIIKDEKRCQVLFSVSTHTFLGLPRPLKVALSPSFSAIFNTQSQLPKGLLFSTDLRIF